MLQMKIYEEADNLAQKYLLRYCTVVGVLLAAAVLFGNVAQTCSYRAYRMWKKRLGTGMWRRLGREIQGAERCFREGGSVHTVISGGADHVCGSLVGGCEIAKIRS